MSKIAIIGGSGLYNVDGFDVIKEHDVDTPFGKTSDKIIEVEHSGHRCYFLARHCRGHRISPSDVNYRANIYALKKLGVRNIISISAVGSLKEEHAPTKFVLPDQFIDWTKGLRARTFFGEGVVGHVSVAEPVDLSLHKRLNTILKNEEVNFSAGGSYLCIEGPQFSTKAESNIYRSFGADVIGMTNVPEAFLAKEAGIAYATIAMVTDYDCWKEEHCTLEEIMKVMGENNKTAQKIIPQIIDDLSKTPLEYVRENEFAIVTNPDLIPEDKKEIIETLLSK
jgi:5'-methylthioadenosine phosphorylase